MLRSDGITTYRRGGNGAMKPVRVLVVDDSATMRALIRATLGADKRIEVVGEAADPLEAREAIKALNPDVMTLDVEMPNMNGLEFLEKVMRLRPMPVVMVSILTERGADATIAALEIGAVDCVAKPSPQRPNAFADLADKVMAAAGAQVHARAPAPPASTAPGGAPPRRRADGCALERRALVAIGSSTGGVEALMAILSQLPAQLPADGDHPAHAGDVHQELRPAARPPLRAAVQEAVDGAPLLPGYVYLAPGSARASRGRRAPSRWRCALREGDLVNGHRPSVDVLFHSVARHVGAKAVGVILTGMGRDGAQGLLAMRKAGARTLGQDEATCVVYGMPKAAYQIGAVEKQAPLHIDRRRTRRAHRSNLRTADHARRQTAGSDDRRRHLGQPHADDGVAAGDRHRRPFARQGRRGGADPAQGEAGASGHLRPYMPKLDGLGLLQALRATPPTAKIGFILVTGRAEKSLVDRGRQFGLNNFIAKPFTTQAIRAAIEAVVGRLT